MARTSRNKSKELPRKQKDRSRTRRSTAARKSKRMSKKPKGKKGKKGKIYREIILEVFNNHYAPNRKRFVVTRPELVTAAAKHGIKLTEEDDEESVTKNIG